MALVLLVVLTTTHLENSHFIVTTVCHNSNQYLCTFDQGSTKFDAVARANGEDLIDGEFGTNVCRYLFYFKFFASDNFILFATGFYDRVHDLKPHQMLRKIPPRSCLASSIETGEPLIIHGKGFSVKNYSQSGAGVVCEQSCSSGQGGDLPPKRPYLHWI